MILDFGFWILDFGYVARTEALDFGLRLSLAIQNPKSKLQNRLGVL
jgi:hypothetical protein